MRAEAIAAIDAIRPEKADAMASMKVNLYMKPADRNFPLAVGDVLFDDGPGAHPNPRMDFQFDLALNEIEVQRGAGILEVDECGEAVEAVLATLEPHLT